MNESKDTITPDMVGQVTLHLNEDCLTVAVVLTRNGKTTRVTFDDPDLITKVVVATSQVSTDGMLQAAAEAVCGDYEAECHMYQSVC